MKLKQSFAKHATTFDELAFGKTSKTWTLLRASTKPTLLCSFALDKKASLYQHSKARRQTKLCFDKHTYQLSWSLHVGLKGKAKLNAN
jgi:hypothetical protein